MADSSSSLIEKFNQRFPVGSMVFWRSVNHRAYEHRVYTVRMAAFDHHGTAVCFFNERRGICSVEPGFVDYERTPPAAASAVNRDNSIEAMRKSADADTFRTIFCGGDSSGFTTI
jgi:hypothetical protein